MGIDNLAANFLRFARRKQPLGTVATMGRQELHISGDLSKLYGTGNLLDGVFCEEFLCKYFGATKVESFDYSDYENATFIADMNAPLDEFPVYDTVIDSGTLEHIYNVPQALSNLSKLCQVGGQIIHITPANNECGHGLWQMSPELFFSLYSEGNGFVDTCVFVASRDDEKHWYEVIKPNEGDRAYVQSLAPLSVLCRTTKVSNHPIVSVQQSDYAFVWSGGEVSDRAKESDKRRPTQGATHSRFVAAIKARAWSFCRSSTHMLTILRLLNFLFISRTTVSVRNPRLVRRSVDELISGNAGSRSRGHADQPVGAISSARASSKGQSRSLD